MHFENDGNGVSQQTPSAKSHSRLERDRRTYTKEEMKSLKLSGEYESKYAKKIIYALAFWRFVRCFFIYPTEYYDRGCLGHFREEVSEMLFQKAEHGFGFVPLVAKIQLLPLAVWRKALSFYNIDFSSFESFLRRLTPKQKAGIEEAYSAIYAEHPRLPRCFTEGWFNRMRQRSPWKVNLTDLCHGKYPYPFGQYTERHSLKVDFFGGFGIREYDNESTDMGFPWAFAIDGEDGAICAWAYRNAPPKFLWSPARAERLPTNLCQILRQAFFSWSIFLIVSPAVFFWLLSSGIPQLPVWIFDEWDISFRVDSLNSLWIIAVVSVGLFTPAVLCAGAVRLVKKISNDSKHLQRKARISMRLCYFFAVLVGAYYFVAGLHPTVISSSSVVLQKTEIWQAVAGLILAGALAGMVGAFLWRKKRFRKMEPIMRGCALLKQEKKLVQFFLTGNAWIQDLPEEQAVSVLQRLIRFVTEHQFLDYNFALNMLCRLDERGFALIDAYEQGIPHLKDHSAPQKHEGFCQIVSIVRSAATGLDVFAAGDQEPFVWFFLLDYLVAGCPFDEGVNESVRKFDQKQKEYVQIVIPHSWYKRMAYLCGILKKMCPIIPTPKNL